MYFILFIFLEDFLSFIALNCCIFICSSSKKTGQAMARGPDYSPLGFFNLEPPKTLVQGLVNTGKFGTESLGLFLYNLFREVIKTSTHTEEESKRARERERERALFSKNIYWLIIVANVISYHIVASVTRYIVKSCKGGQTCVLP